MKFECLIALLVWSSLDSSIAYSFPSRSNHVSCRTSSDNWSTTQLNADERYMKTYAFNSDDEDAVLDYFNNLEGSIHLIATVVS